MSILRINNIYRTNDPWLGKEPPIKRRASSTAALWIFLFLIVVVPVQLSMAENGPYEDLYGKELQGASFAMRFHFQEESGKSWREASYDERLQFIQQWEQLEQQKKDLKAQDDAASQRELEQKRSAKEQAKTIEQQKIAAREQVKQNRIMAEQQKKQQFDQMIQQQKQRIADMKNR